MTWNNSMSNGTKTNIRGELQSIKLSLPEYYQKLFRTYGSYQQVICSVRQLLELLCADKGLDYDRHVPARLKKGVNWAAHSTRNTNFNHTEVTDDHQEQMVEDLWAWLKKYDLLCESNYYSGSNESSEDESDMLHQLANALKLLNVNQPTVCKFWARGNCRYGDSCRFAHVKA